MDAHVFSARFLQLSFFIYLSLSFVLSLSSLSSLSLQNKRKKTNNKIEQKFVSGLFRSSVMSICYQGREATQRGAFVILSSACFCELFVFSGFLFVVSANTIFFLDLF